MRPHDFVKCYFQSTFYNETAKSGHKPPSETDPTALSVTGLDIGVASLCIMGDGYLRPRFIHYPAWLPVHV